MWVIKNNQNLWTAGRYRGVGRGEEKKCIIAFSVQKNSFRCLLSSSRRCLSIFYGQQFREG